MDWFIETSNKIFISMNNKFAKLQKDLRYYYHKKDKLEISQK